VPFITTSLPNGGLTTHFYIAYLDTLSKADGLDQALALMDACESDHQLIVNWFRGQRSEFAFPINVLIDAGSGGASWVDPPDIALSGWHNTVTINAGTGAPTFLLRYLLVSEVTEMYMASQRSWWFERRYIFHGGDEGSMGESLSRFLGAQFLQITNLAKAIPAGFSVANLWLNDPLRPNFIEVAPDDNMPDTVTGCGTCFLWYLHRQLGHSVEDIVAAPANTLATLAGVYQHLTGKNDAWTAFRDLVNLHYPQDGTNYFPPTDNLFPVANLQTWSVPPKVSWVTNGSPNLAWLFLNRSIDVNVKVTLTSDDPSIGMQGSVLMMSSTPVPLQVVAQGPAFVEKTVTLTASYAGQTVTAAVKIVRPENLLGVEVIPFTAENPCAQRFVEGDSEDLGVRNVGVFNDPTGLTYEWSVSGAAIGTNTAPTLNIPALPPAGTHVTVNVSVKNASGIGARGKYEFTTAERETGLRAELREFNCSLRRLDYYKTSFLPPWVLVEDETLEVSLETERVAKIRDEAQQVAEAADRVVTAMDAVRSERAL
jgi:hypothetical protein